MARFSINRTNGGLRVKRWLRRVHLCGVEGATLYVGERVALHRQSELWPAPPPDPLPFYVSCMPFETVGSTTFHPDYKTALAHAKQELLAQDVGERLEARRDA